MTPNYPVNARRKWVRWIGIIAKDVQDLVVRDEVFRLSMETVSRTKRIKPSNRFYRWTAWVYGTYAAIGIRRLLDSDDKTYSLLFLLRKIQKNPQVITRRWFVGKYGKYPFSIMGNRDFDALFGASAQSLPQSFIDADVAALEALDKRTWFVFNKLIAHRERLKFGVPKKNKLSYQHVHDGIALLDRVACRWIYVLQQHNRKTLLPGPGGEIDYQADVDEVWA